MRCMTPLHAYLPGIALTALVAVLAIELGNAGWLAAHGISALTMAIVGGIVVGNSIYPLIAARSAAGVQFSKQTLLRLGIVLYGIRLTFQDIQHVGIGGVIIDTIVVCSTFALAWFLGTRLLGLDRKTAMLIGAGSSICGAAAVMATEPVVRGRADQVTVAVSTVVVFGTVAIFLYPVLYHLNIFGINSPAAYGLFAGSTIHEVAQVVAAGRAIGEQAAATAVITKMVRVMLLAPFLLGLSVYLARESTGDVSDANGAGGAAGTTGAIGEAAEAVTVGAAAEAVTVGAAAEAVTVGAVAEAVTVGAVAEAVTVGAVAEAVTVGAVAEAVTVGAATRPRITIPWFALGFVAVTALNSWVTLPAQLTAIATTFDTFVLAMAMAALGLSTHVSAIRNAGIRPLALAGILFVWLIAGGVAINAGVAALLG
jgi:uncharacterized integral membrane protein (TIGR00698 family)